jgi:hypothetical protein
MREAIAMRIGSGPNSTFAAEAGGVTMGRAISESGDRFGKITNGFRLYLVVLNREPSASAHDRCEGRHQHLPQGRGL